VDFRSRSYGGGNGYRVSLRRRRKTRGKVISRAGQKREHGGRRNTRHGYLVGAMSLKGVIFYAKILMVWKV